MQERRILLVRTLVVFACLCLLPLRLTTTPSIPRGLYLVLAPETPEHGALAAVCLPLDLACFGRNRGYLGGSGPCPCHTRPVVKTILGLPGDVVELGEAGLRLNDSRIPGSAPLARDSMGRDLPRIAYGLYRVPASHLWLFGAADRRSWDSRYYGPVPAANVVGSLRPLLTFSR
jgi:conjugative transfer signal peptidase TraF